MQIDEKEFFQEGTLRICSSLDVETFLWESFMYIRNFIPADNVYLTHYYFEERKQLALATASVKGGSMLNLSIIVPPEVNELFGRPEIQTQIIDRAEQYPPAKTWVAKGVLDKDDSMLSLRLIVGEDIIGAVVFTVRGSNRYSQEHARLLMLLREPFTIALSNSLRYRELLELKELLIEDNRFLHSELRQVAGEDVIGADFGLKGVMEMVRQVAPLSSLVMLLGETGTGKEVIANAIHNLSPRKDESLIKVNCGAIPENLMDSELFGHEKGAFTGAISRKRGRFERADGGTIFLDEVGELHPEAQVRLLRVLQEKEIERVGGTESIKVDIRVIAATHRDMEEMVKDGKLREDLYFRLRVFPIGIPPLRDRKGDIPSLVQHFMMNKSREMGLKGIPTLAPGALDQLTAYHWPGNVRELENVVERALILSKGEPLAFNDLQVLVKIWPHPYLEPGTEPESEDLLSLDEVMSRYIRKVLVMTGGRVGGEQGAAHLLQINPSTLRKRMRKLGIPFGRKVNKDGG
jgi:transcriptional regulator with GAF, ATPase, and Fis domain